MKHLKEKMSILIPEHPKVWEITAAQELKYYLAQTALSVKAYGKKAVFHVGNTDAAIKNGFAPEKMLEEEWTETERKLQTMKYVIEKGKSHVYR